MAPFADARWVFALLVLALIPGCTPPAPPPSPSPRPPAALVVEAPRARAPDVLTGTVTDPAGKPLEGALVAAVPHFELEPGDNAPVAIITQSSRDGAFRFSSLSPGRYGVTASSLGLTAAYGGVVTIPEGAGSRSVALKLGTDGIEIAGAVTDETGAPIRGAIVGAVPLSEAENCLFSTTTDAEGRYSLTIPPGVPYFVVADASPRPRAYRRIEPEKQVVDLRLERAPPPRPSDEAILAWLRRSAIPLTSARAGSGLDDMEPLRKAIGQARIVALGEATHGSAEIFEVKHRIIELLVERMGFTTIAVEAGFSEALGVDDHIVHGRGDSAAALAGLITTPLQTEEILALIRWMRRYNSDPAHTKKLRFQGFDVVTPAAYKAVLAYLKRVDPAAEPAAREVLSPLLSEETYAGLDPKTLAATQKGAADLIALLDANKKKFSARTSAAAWDIARQHALVLQQADAIIRDPSRRDRAMADNASWLIERLAPGEKIVLWAHNTHVSSHRVGLAELGSLLRQRYGSEYFVIGTSFYRGSFRALDGWGAERRSPGVKDHSVGPAPAGTLEATLALANLPLFAVDLRTAAGPVADWLGSSITTRSVGFFFVDDRRTLSKIIPSRSFDALIFLNEVTAARALAPQNP